MSDEVSLGELSRRLGEVFTRLEQVARRLEDGQFVRSDLFQQTVKSLESSTATLKELIQNLERDKTEKADFLGLEKRVAALEDDRKWIARLVIGFIILGILGAVYAASGGKM